MLDFLKNIGPTELVVIGLIVVMLFGSRIVVNLAKSAGETVRELKKIKKTMGEVVEETGNSLKDTRREVAK